MLIDGEPVPSTNMKTTSKTLFALGALVCTPSVLNDFTPEEQQTCLARHSAGDWGDLDAEDKKANDYALKTGGRILSSYKFAGNRKLWIISEHDRSATTLLKPEEY